MTTPITKEWLQQTIAEYEASRDEIPFGLETNSAMELEAFKIALAAMDAEPVAYSQVQRDMMKDIIVRKLGGNLIGGKLVMDDIHAVTMALIDAGFRTAPPAPVVPDAYIRDERGRMMLNDVCEPKIGFGAGWNACRAAMLNHSENERDVVEPVSQPYKLPERVTNALTLSLQAMEFMGDTLNNLDAVCEEDVEFVAPAFEAVRAALAGNSPVIPDGLNVRAVAALREAVRNQWLKSEDFADKVYWKSMHDIANEIVSAMLAAAPQQEGK